jgi:transposase
MLTSEQINDLHRLYWAEHWPIRKIERHLNMGWQTIKKYLDAPAQGVTKRQRSSKLDPFKTTIAEWLEKDPQVTAALIQQRLIPLGYSGGHSLLRAHVRNVRPQLSTKRAFVRMEPLAGERFEVDWAHFDVLNYSGDIRKLYAFALVDGHSRMLYVEFTHSQNFETFVRCHAHAFHALGGVAREIVYDNLATAVAEHDGRLVRFLPRFLGFARDYNFYPRACNPASGWEKGKVERAIGYLRQSFWPLREFTDLHDVNRQVRQWLVEVANQRLHQGTRERPMERFQPEALRALPIIPYDHRDTVEALVHKDLRLQFDGNKYCVPHRYVGQRLTVKADSSSVTIYERVNEVVSYPRCWRRGQTFGAERFEKRSRRNAPPHDVRKRSNDCSIHSTDCARARCWKPICATWPIATVHWHGRLARSSNSFGNTARTLSPARLRKRPPPVPGERNMSPTSCASNKHRAARSRRCRSAIRSCAIW